MWTLNMGIYNMFIQNGLLFSLKMEINHVIRYTMDEPRDQHMKWIYLGTQMPFNNIYKWRIELIYESLHNGYASG